MFTWIKKKKKEIDPLKKNVKRRKVDLVAKLDRVFSQYIRLRDIMPNGYGRCIACGKIKPYSDLDCGHYFSRIHMATRFEEDNCNAECKFCNRVSSEHLIGYRDNLIRKIGIGRYDRLNVLAHSTKHWQDFELEAMINHYQSEVKRLSELKGIKVK